VDRIELYQAMGISYDQPLAIYVNMLLQKRQFGYNCIHSLFLVIIFSGIVVKYNYIIILLSLLFYDHPKNDFCVTAKK
jgi:hypothetical protein